MHLKHVCFSRFAAWGRAGWDRTRNWLARDACPDRHELDTWHGLDALEPRVLLSAMPLVEVGQQPFGALTGKTVYVHGGHGYQDTDGNGIWQLQRPLLLEMNEDFGNQDQMNFLVDYLWNAGATVVPLRPVGFQVNEVILDNDDVEVTFTGSWSNSRSQVYFGDVGDVPYRFANKSVTETATARYTPNIPEAGFYPVYAWTAYGSNRVDDQLYRVKHTGGTTEVRINHRQVGNGFVYLGSFHFDAGSDGYVEISNQSDDLSGSVVIADAIRFGNGIGPSGFPRHDEAGLYWIISQLGQGLNHTLGGTVSAPPRWAEQMNRATDGTIADRVFFSFHSNAGGGSSRGTLALLNGNNNPATATPNQFTYANIIGGEVNDDLVALNGTFENDWFNRTVHTLDRTDIEFGEINNLYINDEFDATILEVAFHDNLLDTELMRDANVREAVARASTQGIIKYFNQVHGSASADFLPGAVGDVVAFASGPGEIAVSWTAPQAGGVIGDAAVAYRIYSSIDGLGFDGGTVVFGTSHTFTGLAPADGPRYFKVVAVNSGGESPGSEVVAATPGDAGNSDILIVNGFDRLGRSQNPRQSVGGNFTDRVRPRFSNSFDYAVQIGEGIAAHDGSLTFGTAANEAVIGGQVNLADYDAVFWVLGEESSADDTFDLTEQALVQSYLAGGGNLFVSGAEIGWDLDWLNNGRAFYNNTLHADYVADDANTYDVQGVGGSIFDGLSLTFDDGTLFYDTNFPDVINPLGGALTALTYVGGTSPGGGAAIQFDGVGNIVMLGFPFETIVDEADRNEVLSRAIDFFDLAPPVLLGDANKDGQVTGADLISVQQNFGNVGPTPLQGDANNDGQVTGADLISVQQNFGNVLAPVQSAGAAPAATPVALTLVVEESVDSTTPADSQPLATEHEAPSTSGRSDAMRRISRFTRQDANQHNPRSLAEDGWSLHRRGLMAMLQDADPVDVLSLLDPTHRRA